MFSGFQDSQLFRGTPHYPQRAKSTILTSHSKATQQNPPALLRNSTAHSAVVILTTQLLLGMADTVQLGMLIGAAAGMAFCNFIIYILHLFLSFKFGLGLSLFWGVFESLQCILYSNIELKGVARYIPFAWSMNWIQDILSRQIFNYGTEKIWIAALTTGGLLLTLLWFSHWEGRKNYE